MADVFDDGQPCSPQTCGDRGLLAERGVYLTRKPEVVLRTIPRLDSHEDTQLHEVTVVLLDAEGRRIGEAAWYDAFKLEHRDLT
ncbi:unannotated protein [freshwater metagenome]|uniref:Unannotated protein n=1 Tax=freshwater metagenome TaxID=449393 RepID=A0A6J6PGK6_9ZZZZ